VETKIDVEIKEKMGGGSAGELFYLIINYQLRADRDLPRARASERAAPSVCAGPLFGDNHTN
jgi:hypothetical protein